MYRLRRQRRVLGQIHAKPEYPQESCVHRNRILLKMAFPGMPFPKGNRLRAGIHRLQFTESQLRRLILLPAIRQFRIFCEFHRDRVPAIELAQQTGMPLGYLYQMIYSCRRAIGLKRQPIKAPEHRRPRWTFDDHLQLRPGLDARNHFYLWSDAVERATKEYFLAFALHRFHVARLAWVEKRSRVEIARLLGITEATAQAHIQATCRLANGGKQAKVSHRGNKWQHAERKSQTFPQSCARQPNSMACR